MPYISSSITFEIFIATSEIIRGIALVSVPDHLFEKCEWESLWLSGVFPCEDADYMPKVEGKMRKLKKRICSIN